MEAMDQATLLLHVIIVSWASLYPTASLQLHKCSNTGDRDCHIVRQVQEINLSVLMAQKFLYDNIFATAQYHMYTPNATYRSIKFGLYWGIII